ncbi:MAG: BolA family protein [Pseudomonadota bacterium]
MRQSIEDKLRAAFNPSELQVLDESHLHEGHAGHRPGGNTHFRVTMVSDDFAGLSRVAMQRKVMTCLSEEFDAGLHALALHLSAGSSGST